MSTDPSTVEPAASLSKLLYGIAGWLLVGLGTFGIGMTLLRIVSESAPSNPVASAVVVGISMVCVLTGLLVNPRFRRRLTPQYPRTRFGWKNRVETRVVNAKTDSTRCLDCGTQTDDALVRRYQRELVLFGIPVHTASEGSNVYCPACATTSGIDSASSQAELETDEESMGTITDTASE